MGTPMTADTPDPRPPRHQHDPQLADRCDGCAAVKAELAMIEQLGGAPMIRQLAPREYEVLRLQALGLTGREIAHSSGLTVGTAGLDVETLADLLTMRHILEVGFCAESHLYEAKRVLAARLRESTSGS